MKNTEKIKKKLLRENEELKAKLADKYKGTKEEATVKNILSLLDVLRIQREKIEEADQSKVKH